MRVNELVNTRVCVCMRERERERVCVEREREREREREKEIMRKKYKIMDWEKIGFLNAGDCESTFMNADDFGWMYL